ncbi:hypothetical protein J4G08_18950 [Candidatus Poribacteria bacterium]|nr:hypothetical protein [Candidatus Poribacteria bacterium]
MKTQIVCIMSFLVLCMSCTVEQQLRYVGSTGNEECCTLWVRMPDNWKIVNAQLKPKNKPKQVTIEFDRGKGIEKQSLLLSYRNLGLGLISLHDLDENIQFRGTNRLDRLVLLHFTKEDPQNVFTPPLAKSNISKNSKSREVFAVFRTSNWLIVHFTIENTILGNLLSHNLKQHYFGDEKNDQRGTFKFVDGILHFAFGKNKEKRSLPIHKFIEPHKELKLIGRHRGRANSKIDWTWHFKIVSKQKVVQ